MLPQASGRDWTTPALVGAPPSLVSPLSCLVNEESRLNQGPPGQDGGCPHTLITWRAGGRPAGPEQGGRWTPGVWGSQNCVSPSLPWPGGEGEVWGALGIALGSKRE